MTNMVSNIYEEISKVIKKLKSTKIYIDIEQWVKENPSRAFIGVLIVLFFYSQSRKQNNIVVTLGRLT
jgi:hypothetical protein